MSIVTDLDRIGEGDAGTTVTSDSLVSCLCVTEDREDFLPWLLWAFERQTYAHRELVVVSGSPVPRALADHPQVRVISVEPRMPVPDKRNAALDAARGDIVAWFDDDDWQHPSRIERIARAIVRGAVVAGTSSAWFADLLGGGCERYPSRNQVLFNGAGFRADLARPVRFDSHVLRASDQRWLAALKSLRAGPWCELPGDDAFFWLCHDRNLSNPARRRRFAEPIERLRAVIGEAWLDTDAHLEALRERVRARRTREDARVEVEPRSRHRSRAGPTPPVAAVVKATTLDVPYLRATLPHMLRQAGIAFCERILVLDRRVLFEGKYRSRAKASIEDLDGVAGEMVARGVVDRLVVVDAEPEKRGEVLARYFGHHASAVPTHASSGGPIYATLLGLESAQVDHVVQFDADMLFHASGESWVQAGLQILDADPSVWLVMTQGGPPAGALGTAASLGPRNRPRAQWDPALRVWRYATASTRYFLTDRRRLHGRLTPIPMRGGCAPLENCISRAMERERASRVCLAIPGSWDLHPLSHEPPFPNWVARIVESVERGVIPDLQRGEYDLRLERARDREAWANVLAPEPPPGPLPVASMSAATTVYGSRDGRCAPIAVVIPVRDRAGARLRRSLASLRWQTTGPPSQVVIVSHGSRADTDAELASLCQEIGATFLSTGTPKDPWRKPLALNMGLRATDPGVPFVMTMDADMILAPDFLEVVLGVLSGDARRFVLCRSSDLDRTTTLPNPELAPAVYPALKKGATLRGRHGTGGIQAAARSFFFEVRGYDEDLEWWGAEDGDMVSRAQHCGLAIEWVCDRTSMLHQWHPKTFAALDDPISREAARTAWTRNHALVRARAGRPLRNDEAWGTVGRAPRPLPRAKVQFPRRVAGSRMAVAPRGGGPSVCPLDLAASIAAPGRLAVRPWTPRGEVSPLTATRRATLRELRERYCTEVSSDAMALSYEAMCFIAEVLASECATSVLDLGAGYTSAGLRRLRDEGALPSVARIVSVDDDAAWLERAREFCRASGLDGLDFRLWESLEVERFDFVVYDLGNMHTRARFARQVLDRVVDGGLVYYDDLHKRGYADAVARSAHGRAVTFYDVTAQTRDHFGRFGMLARARESQGSSGAARGRS